MGGGWYTWDFHGRGRNKSCLTPNWNPTLRVQSSPSRALCLRTQLVFFLLSSSPPALLIFLPFLLKILSILNFWDRVLLCSPSWTSACSMAQEGLELPTLSLPQGMMGSQTHTTIHGSDKFPKAWFSNLSPPPPSVCDLNQVMDAIYSGRCFPPQLMDLRWPSMGMLQACLPAASRTFLMDN